jgi:hypothetical protein
MKISTTQSTSIMEILLLSVEVIDYISGNDELSLLRATVVSEEIAGVLKTQFRAEKNRRAYPPAIAEQVFKVLGGISRCPLILSTNSLAHFRQPFFMSRKAMPVKVP